MNNMIDFLLSREAIIVYIIASIIVVSYIIFCYLRRTRQKRLQRQNTVELRKIVSNGLEEGYTIENSNESEKKFHTKEENPYDKNLQVAAVTSLESLNNAVVTNKIESNTPKYTIPSQNLEKSQSVNNININNSEVKLEKEIKNDIKKSIIVEEKTSSVNVSPIESNNVVLEDVRKTQNQISSVVDKNKKDAHMDEVLRKLYDTNVNINSHISNTNISKEVSNFVKPKPVIKEEQEELPVIKIEEIVDEVQEEKEQESAVNINEIEDENISLEGIVYTNNEPDQEEARRTLEEVTKKLEEEQAQDKNIKLTEFEQMQEDTAIISLDELMKRADTLYQYNEQNQYLDEGNEPISIMDLEKRKEQLLNVCQEEVEEPVINIVEATEENYNIKESNISLENTFNTNFKSSQIISPVYGIEKNNINKNTELELENTANYEKLDEEIRKTNEFIKTLKELQKKLD